MLTRWIDTAVLIIFTAPVLVLSNLLARRDTARLGKRRPADTLISAQNSA